MVANVAPSAQVVKSLDRMSWDVPIVSHWGPSGGRFSELAGPSGAKVHFIQTYSFSGKLSSKGEGVLAGLKKKYPEIKSLADVTPAVGIANAYDAMHLTALAIAKAGSTEGPKIRDAFYAIDNYDGLIKSYAKPFTPRTTTRSGRTTICSLTSRKVKFFHSQTDAAPRDLLAGLG